MDRYRVHDWMKYQYSEIGEYINEGYTDRPLRNDELVKILNLQEKQIEELEKQLLDFSKLANENDMTIDKLYQYMKSYFDSRHENTYWCPEMVIK